MRHIRKIKLNESNKDNDELNAILRRLKRFTEEYFGKLDEYVDVDIDDCDDVEGVFQFIFTKLGSHNNSINLSLEFLKMLHYDDEQLIILPKTFKGKNYVMFILFFQYEYLNEYLDDYDVPSSEEIEIEDATATYNI